MQKFVLLLCSASAIVALGVGLSSCKDDEPFVKPNLSVASKTVSFSEGAGTIEVEVVLDKGAPADITIEYDLGGTALSPADYSIVGKEGEVEIAKGATSGTISIQIVSDAIYEGDETIEISLEDVDSDDVLITNDDETVVTITDDDPQIQVSFTVTTMAVNEADGLIEVEVSLTQAATSNVTIDYTLSGSAVDSIKAKNTTPNPIPADYAIRDGLSGKVEIASGQQTGIIKIGLYSDFYIEDGDGATDPWDPETIVISLTAANAGVQIVGDKDEIVIEVDQQDGKIIALFWEEEYTTVDMDMFLWVKNSAGEFGIIGSSIVPSFDSPEVIFIPGIISDAELGLSYVYYEGDVSPMNFEAHFIDFANGAIADRDIYPATYTLVNINKWDEDDAIDPIVVQSFNIVDGVYVDITDPIVAPASGSRIPSYVLPKNIKKTTAGQINISRKF